MVTLSLLCLFNQSRYGDAPGPFALSFIYPVNQLPNASAYHSPASSIGIGYMESGWDDEGKTRIRCVSNGG